MNSSIVVFQVNQYMWLYAGRQACSSSQQVASKWSVSSRLCFNVASKERVLPHLLMPLSTLILLLLRMSPGLYSNLSFPVMPPRMKLTVHPKILMPLSKVLSESRFQIFTYRQLKDATNSFSLRLGRGGFGSVYYGN